jgi:CRP/FNR family transcriptional regulator, nitrogen oxide reductase regulator
VNRWQFLEGLDPADARAVLAASTTRRLPPHVNIYEQTQPASSVFLLSSGRARYFSMTPDGRKMILHWLMPGDALGLAALLQTPSPYRVSAETVRESTVLVWRRMVMHELMNEYPRLLHNALTVSVAYLDLYIAAHAALVSESAKQRLASVLVRLTDSIGNDVSDGVELQVTNEELASAANITLFTASRILSEWQSEHALTKRRGRIILHSPKGLLRLTA